MANLNVTGLATQIVSRDIGPALIRKTATITPTVAPSLNDKWHMMRLPRCRVVGGELKGRKIDTNATPTVRLDVGILTGYSLATGSPVGGSYAQTQLHADTVAITAVAVADHVIADGAPLFFHHFNKLVDGDVLLTNDESIVAINVTAVCATFASGPITVAIDYVEL